MFEYVLNLTHRSNVEILCAIVFELKKAVIDKKPKIRYLNISMLI